MKTRILTVLLCISLLLTMVGMCACANTSNQAKAFGKRMKPEEKLTYSIETAVEKATLTATNAVRENATHDGLQQAIKQGSVLLEVSNLQKSGVSGLTAKIWFNSSNAAAMDLQMQNEQGETIDMSAWLEAEQEIIVQSQALFGGAYGVNLQTLGEDILTWAMANPEAIQKLDANTIQEYTKSVDRIKELLEQVDQWDAETQRQEAVDLVKNVLLQSILQTVKITESTKTISALEKEISTFCLSFPLTNEILAQMLECANSLLQSQPQFRTRVETIFELFQSELAEDESAPQSPEELYVELDADIAKLVRALRSAQNPIEGQTRVYLNSQGTLVRVDVDVICNEKTTTATLELDENPDAFEELKFTLRKNEQEINLHARAEELANGKAIAFEADGLGDLFSGIAGLSGRLVCRESGKTECNFEIIKKAATLDTETWSASYEYQKEGTTHTWQSFTVVKNGNAIQLPSVKITVQEEDALPEKPEYNNLFDLSKEDMNSMRDQAQEALQSFGMEEGQWSDLLPTVRQIPVYENDSEDGETDASAIETTPGQEDTTNQDPYLDGNTLEPDFK